MHFLSAIPTSALQRKDWAEAAGQAEGLHLLQCQLIPLELDYKDQLMISHVTVA